MPRRGYAKIPSSSAIVDGGIGEHVCSSQKEFVPRCAGIEPHGIPVRAHRFAGECFGVVGGGPRGTGEAPHGWPHYGRYFSSTVLERERCSLRETPERYNAAGEGAAE